MFGVFGKHKANEVMSEMHNFGGNPMERHQKEDDDIFLQAVRLVFPDVSQTDTRLVEVADYLRKRYAAHYNCPSAMLMPVPSEEEYLKLCNKLKLDPGRREVLVKGGHVYFTSDCDVEGPRRVYAIGY